jgi:hypothetical protein
MKYFACLIGCFICCCCSAQFICGTASENGTLTLTAPAGNYFTTIQFASYGTPNGSCGSFTTSACHAANSVSICSTAFVGKTSASVSASNGVFGDPCVGTVKRLYVQAAYASIVPLKLISFVVRNENGMIILDWVCEDEVNTSHFVVESSDDGQSFNEVGRVPAKGGEHSDYRYSIRAGTANMFRLKMVDKDEKFTISKIVRLNNTSGIRMLQVYPNPATNEITVYNDKRVVLSIVNMQGQVIRKLSSQQQYKIFIGDLAPGAYFLRGENQSVKFFKR